MRRSDNKPGTRLTPEVCKGGASQSGIVELQTPLEYTCSQTMKHELRGLISLVFGHEVPK